MKIQQLEDEIVKLREQEKQIKEKLDSKKSLLWAEFDKKVTREAFMVHLPDDFETTPDAEFYLNYRYPYYEIEEIDLSAGVAYLVPPATYFKYSSGRIERRISNPTPTVDLEKLKSLDEDLYERVTSVERVFDAEKFDKAMEENPSVLGVIEQCLIAQKPRVSLHIVGDK